MEEAFEGGCACGAVRYRLGSAPYDTGWCHCRICQKVSGAPAMVFSTVLRVDYDILQGEEAVGIFRSTRFGQRRFCTRCGTPLTMEVDHQPETIDFTVASLDQPDRVAPGFHIFRESRIGWFETADTLPRHDRFRPNTRGLEGTDTPDESGP